MVLKEHCGYPCIVFGANSFSCPTEDFGGRNSGKFSYSLNEKLYLHCSLCCLSHAENNVGNVTLNAYKIVVKQQGINGAEIADPCH